MLNGESTASRLSPYPVARVLDQPFPILLPKRLQLVLGVPNRLPQLLQILRTRRVHKQLPQPFNFPRPPGEGQGGRSPLCP
jgi:hypothetical protein